MLDFRPITIEDLPHRAKWLSDADITKYLGTTTRLGQDLDFHKKWFEEYQKSDKKRIFIIEFDGKPIGQVGLLDINFKDRNNASLYLVIGEKEYWGKGIGQKALEFICNFGFKDLGLHKIWLEVHADNEAAIKCYKKFGFEQEGYYKDNVFYDEKKYKDEIRMAIFENMNNQ